MKIRKLMALVLCAALIMLCGCGEPKSPKVPELSESETPPAAASYKTMKLGANGRLEITRKEPGNIPMGEDGSWTIFVYMSGSNLEATQSSGSRDMEEMCKAASGNIRFVVQTGGSTNWQHGEISSQALQRHVISNGERQTVAQLPLASMGEAATLRNFIEWGVENYPAAKMGLVLWGHGRGSLGGVCKDDLFDGDYLELREINSALSEASTVMTDKFEFIGFDACYMGTLETADIAASYARYMIASEELEPVDGWNYAELGELLVNDPNAGWDKLAESFCESFLTESEKSEHLSRVTLSVIDLSKIDELLARLNDYSRSLCGKLTSRSDLRELKKTLEAGEHFGNDTIYDGYSNSIDLHDFIGAGEVITDTSEIESALERVVIRKSNGGGHPTASGLTVYFPFRVYGTKELRKVAGFAQCPFYIEFLETIMLSASPAFDCSKLRTGFIAELCFGETGIENSPLCDHWSDLGEDATGGNVSALVKTAGEFSVGNDGKYKFSVTPETLRYASSVGVQMFWRLEFGQNESYTSLGTMTALRSDWESGDFSGTVNGYWIMFPNREPLAVKPCEITENGVTYVSNIRLEKEKKGVTITADNVGRVSLDGCWNYGENGRYTLEAVPDGSTCTPFRDNHPYGGAPEANTLGNKMVFDGAPRITCDMLGDGDYYCILEITDVYGDTFRSEITDFSIIGGKLDFTPYSPNE